MIPWAGAGPTCYHGWAEHLSSAIEPWASCLPGRESRFGEPLPSDLHRLVDGLATAIAPWADRPFAVFGHSLGALLGFELCRALRARDLPLPLHLFVSGLAAPQRRGEPSPERGGSDAELLDELETYGAMPPEVLANAELLELLLPAIRADLELARRYRYRASAPLPIPLTAFGGDDDVDAPVDSLAEWGELTDRRFRCRSFAGGHFYLVERVASLSSELEAELHLDLARGREGA